MSNNGKDTSGNSFKLSLIPLLIGCALIFFLYRSCQNTVFTPQVQKATTEVVEDETSTAERPVEIVTETATTTEDAAATTEVATDSVATAE